MVGVDALTLEPNEIEYVLTQHGERLSKHEQDINELKLTTEISKEKLSNLEKSNESILGTLARMETSMYSGQNTLTQAMTQLLINTSNNKTTIETTKLSSRKEIILKMLGIGGILLIGFLLGDKVNIGSLVTGLF